MSENQARLHAIILEAVEKCSPTSDGERVCLYSIIEQAVKEASEPKEVLTDSNTRLPESPATSPSGRTASGGEKFRIVQANRDCFKMYLFGHFIGTCSSEYLAHRREKNIADKINRYIHEEVRRRLPEALATQLRAAKESGHLRHKDGCHAEITEKDIANYRKRVGYTHHFAPVAGGYFCDLCRNGWKHTDYATSHEIWCPAVTDWKRPPCSCGFSERFGEI